MPENTDVLDPSLDPTDVPMETFGEGEEAPLDASTAPPVAEDLEEPPAPAPSPPPRGVVDMQRRINKLFAQKRAAEEGRAAEQERVRALEARLVELEERATRPVPPYYTPPSAPPDPVTGFNPYGQFSAPPHPLPPPTLDPRQLAVIFSQAISPLVERLNARDALDALAGAHEQSWAVAAEEFPELSTANSTLRRTAETLLRQDPELSRSANGPYRAVLTARGLLADTPTAPSPQLKARASTVVAAGPTEGRTLAQLKSEYAKLMAASVQDFRQYARAKQLREQIMALQQQRG